MTSPRLPTELLPSDGRFGSGPSRVPQSAVEALARAAPTYLGTSHRRDGVREVVRRLRGGIAALLQLPDDYEVALGNGGSSVFWDVAAYSLVERRSQHLVFGEFSRKFAESVAVAPHLEEPDLRASAMGSHPEPDPGADVDTFALTHNETSTGVQMAVRRPGGRGLVIVDATSAAGGLRVDATQFDAYYFAPQKCLAADAGLWIACLSPAALERAQRIAASRPQPPSLSLSLALASSRKDQTHNTPALATLFLALHQVDTLNAAGGLECAAARCDASAAVVYTWAEASSYAEPFVADPASRSHTVATIDLDDAVSADAVSQALRANGIVDTEGYRGLHRNQLRLAMFPAIPTEDLERLTLAIDYIVERLG